MGIEEITALAVYQAAQPRPVTGTELSDARDALVRRFGAAGARTAANLGLESVGRDNLVRIPCSAI